MTGFFASCKKARPFAAPTAIFILVDHGKDAEYPEIFPPYKKLNPSFLFCKLNETIINQDKNIIF